MIINIKWMIYAYITALFSFTIFLFGFFPLSINSHGYSNIDHLPKFKTKFGNISEIYSASVNKVVLIVIDAFRDDFLFNSHDDMPYLQNIIKSGNACSFISKVQTPTVTLPRIKAITTGYIPAYIDIVLNFGSQELQTDNIIYQINSLNKNITFYGDDTWLKLFPNSFKRSEGTTSFYVSDFYEVDENVTRNMENELLKNDWSVMILHYLGLDHIGHVEGPQGIHIKSKLREMDNVVQKIHMNLMEMKSNNSLLVVSGDHGMRDSGGHGGSSKPETHVPLIFIGDICNNKTSRIEHAQQIDLAPTLSVLMGTPIPMGSIGRVLDSALSNFDSKQKLYALYYNAKQLAKHCEQRLDDIQSFEFYKDYLKAVNFYKEWLLNGSTDNMLEKQSYNFFITSISEMSKRLSLLGTNYNNFYLLLSIILQFEALLIILLTLFMTNIISKLFKNFYKTILYITITITILTGTHKICTQEIFTIYKLFLNFILSIMLCLNHDIIKTTVRKSSIHLKNFNHESIFVILGIIFHTLSLSATSYIEEEHMIFYHLSSSYIIVLLFSHICQIFGTDRNINNHEKILKLISSLASLRFLRDVNSTGDKHQNAFDYSDWLTDSNHTTEYSIIYIISLCGAYTTVANYLNSNGILKHTSLLFIFYHIYCFKSLSNNLIKINFYFFSPEYILINLLVIMLIIFVISFKKTPKCRLFLALFLLYLTFLHRPYNVGMLPMIVFVLNCIFDMDVNHAKTIFCPKYVGAIWIGCAFYFMQGNSNNLATVDVASGYAGLSFYNPFIVGFQIAILMYSGPLLAIVITLVNMRENHIDKFLANIVLCETIPLTWYLVMVYLQRNHLFAWTVFAPKLMYEAMHFVVNFIAGLVLWAIYTFLNKPKVL